MKKINGAEATAEEIGLLCRDLKSRIDYGVIVSSGVSNISNEWVCADKTKIYGVYEDNEFLLHECDHDAVLKVESDDYVYPYLYPLEKLDESVLHVLKEYLKGFAEGLERNYAEIIWYYKNHIDFRGLIAKDLAIDCTDKDIYKDNSVVCMLEKKYDFSNLNGFDKVLVRNSNDGKWSVSFFSYTMWTNNYPFICLNGGCFRQCVPYNEETKGLLGTNNECPKMYIVWD